MRNRLLRSTVFAAVLALPLALTGCEDLGLTSSDDVDGTYTLVSVNGDGLPFTMSYYDASNQLVLTEGRWTLSGSTLSTYMAGYMIISGQRENWDEYHTGTVTVSGNRATGTLDSGSSVTATIEGGTLLSDSYGNSLKFVKN